MPVPRVPARLLMQLSCPLRSPKTRMVRDEMADQEQAAQKGKLSALVCLHIVGFGRVSGESEEPLLWVTQPTFPYDWPQHRLVVMSLYVDIFPCRVFGSCQNSRRSLGPWEWEKRELASSIFGFTYALCVRDDVANDLPGRSTKIKYPGFDPQPVVLLYFWGTLRLRPAWQAQGICQVISSRLLPLYIYIYMVVSIRGTEELPELPDFFKTWFQPWNRPLFFLFCLIPDRPSDTMAACLVQASPSLHEACQAEILEPKGSRGALGGHVSTRRDLETSRRVSRHQRDERPQERGAKRWIAHGAVGLM